MLEVGKKVILYFYPKDNTPGCTLQRLTRDLKKNYGKVSMGVVKTTYLIDNSMIVTYNPY